MDSTQDELRRRLDGGAGDNTVVRAKRQTAGRGRRGRAWLTHSGSLAFSTAAFPLSVPEKLPRATQCVGFGLLRALDGFLTNDAEPLYVKWPNDIVSISPETEQGFRKLAGILVEVDWIDGQPRIQIGVGVNLTSPAEGFGEMDGIAGVLMDSAAERPADLLLRQILNEIRISVVNYHDDTHFETVRRTLWQRNILSDARVETAALSGLARGIAADGSLLVESDDGQMHRISAGEVRIR